MFNIRINVDMISVDGIYYIRCYTARSQDWKADREPRTVGRMQANENSEMFGDACKDIVWDATWTLHDDRSMRHTSKNEFQLDHFHSSSGHKWYRSFVRWLVRISAQPLSLEAETFPNFSFHHFPFISSADCHRFASSNNTCSWIRLVSISYAAFAVC